MSDWLNRCHFGDCLEVLRGMPDGIVNTCVTSPPYFGLRDYSTATWEGGDPSCAHVGNKARTVSGGAGKQYSNAGSNRVFSGDCDCGAQRVDHQIGLEQTPEEFVAKLVEVFREVRRVLKPDGTLFLNIGDSYSSSTMFAQSFKMREDLTDQEKRHVAVEMFGMRFDGPNQAGQGFVPQVLPSEIHCREVCSGSDVASEGVEAKLRAQQGKGHRQNHGAAASAEEGSDSAAGRQVRVLRGVSPRVPDGGSCEQRRRCTSEGVDGQEPSQFDQDLSGHSEVGIPAEPVPGALLQLQLLNRVLGILSAHAFSEHEIPAAVKPLFRAEVSLKPKDLIGIPWMLAFALRADGWYLRQEIIWSKPNVMPESMEDRCTKSHEQIFLLSKSRIYHFDHEAIKEPCESSESDLRKMREQLPRIGGKHKDLIDPLAMASSATNIGQKRSVGDGERRHKRTVWTVATATYNGAHFATFPTKLIEPCILAGAPAGGVVLDPFFGSGTTGQVSQALGRKYIGIELNRDYEPLQIERLRQPSLDLEAA